MKNYISFCCILALLFSCKDSASEENKVSDKTTISSVIVSTKEDTSNNALLAGEREKAAYKDLKKLTPLSSKELLPFLPEFINAQNNFNKYAYPGKQQMVTGSYGSFDNSYNFSIEDGAGSRSIVRSFFDSYKIKPQGPPQTEYIYSERGGYKTVAFVQPKINRNQISFIYKNRFKITLEGPDSADVLWTYIDFENLKKLDQLN